MACHQIGLFLISKAFLFTALRSQFGYHYFENPSPRPSS